MNADTRKLCINQPEVVTLAVFSLQVQRLPSWSFECYDPVIRPFSIAISRITLRFKLAAPRNIHENFDSKIESILGLWGLWIPLFSILDQNAAFGEDTQQTTAFVMPQEPPQFLQG